MKLTTLTDAEFNELFTTFERTAFRLDRTAHADLEALREDFWLFDERDLILMRYDPDGRYLGAERATDPDLGEYLRRRDLALAHAVPLRDYVKGADA